MNINDNANDGTHRNSSRVLKPPGGGHTDLFGPAEVKVNRPRPKYNQQNSSNLNAVVNSMDPNEQVKKLQEEIEKTPANNAANQFGNGPNATNGASHAQTGGSQDSAQSGRQRVPPGGFSSGFW